MDIELHEKSIKTKGVERTVRVPFRFILEFEIKYYPMSMSTVISFGRSVVPVMRNEISMNSAWKWMN